MLTTATSRQLLELLQICDSNFPVGAFSHSYGMETYLRDDIIKDKETFEAYIKVYLKGQFMYTDGLAIRLVYEALNANQLDKLWEIDRQITVQSMARETREGTKKVGQRMLQMILDLYDNDILKNYQE
ncbi:MAG: urease accessory protein UreF, partial [Candidatus Cellulosilyticum pullistercoris]|nr:urease accessory protein UreF [Candidatus Cellulosilyticum pullistercoris]